MADSFATPSDLEARWRPLTSTEIGQAVELLADASSRLRAACPDIDTRLTAVPPTIDARVPVMVVCAMVKRAMSTGTEGVTAQQESVGPFAQSLTFANPQGNLYLTRDDKRLLGIAGVRAFTIDTTPVDTTTTT